MSDPKLYHELYDDMSSSNRWYLDAPVGSGGEWLGTALTRAEKYEGPLPLRVAIYQAGPSLELTDATDAVLVVNGRVAKLIENVAPRDVQLVPVEVEGTSDPHFVVNTLYEPECIDEHRSADARRYTIEDGYPDRVGRFKAVGGLKIDASRVGGLHIFRPWGWPWVIIVSDALAEALRAADVRCQITPVT